MKVLLVEDVPLAAKISAFLLRALNCEVDAVETGQDALQKVMTHHYDFILMDIGLPDYDGFMVTERIRQFSDVPIYALTAQADEAHRQQAFASDMTGFLTKPLNESEIKNIMAKIKYAEYAAKQNTLIDSTHEQIE